MFRDMMDFLRLPRLSDSQRPLGSRAPAGIRPPSPMGILAAARMGAALTMLFLVACGIPPSEWQAARRAYASGNMVEATRNAGLTLRREPGYEDAVRFLLDEVPRAYETYYRSAQTAGSLNDWDRAFEAYLNLQEVSDLVAGIPPQRHPDTGERLSFPTRDVHAELDAARMNAAELHYERATSFEDQGRYVDAARAYERALQYVDPFRDAGERHARVREAAVQRVAVMPLENGTGRSQHEHLGSVVSEYIIMGVMTDPLNLEFLDLISRDRLNQLMAEHQLGDTGILDPATAAETGRVLGLDAMVFGRITSVTANRPPQAVQDNRHSREISQGRDRPRIRVNAVTRKTTRRADARIIATFQIVDVSTGRFLQSGRQEAHQEVVIEFCRMVAGDERALDRSTREMCSRPEEHPPAPDELIQRAAETVAALLAADIASHFR
jgi:TolB-like protein